MILLFLACAEIPEPCAEMCGAMAALRGECLAEAGQSWSGLGYADAADFQASCETWAWESRLLERDAGCRGWTQEICEVRESELRTGNIDCAEAAELDWNSSPAADETCGG